MFFVLSKTLTFLVMPLTIIFALLLFSAVTGNKRWKRISFLSGVVLLFLCSNEYVANEAMRAWELPARPYHGMQKYKLGIVLTGAVMHGLTPDDRVYFTRGADRVVHTVQLYKKGLLERILISGGSGRIVDTSEREADQFRDAMLLMGVPDSVILIENETRNTAESAMEVKKMLAGLNYEGRDCVLITSAFHMRRSLACYRKVGLHPETFSTDFYSRPPEYFVDAFLIPKLDALIIWHKLAREWAGFAAYKAAGYV